MGGGRRLSPTFDEWRIEYEEEDLASGGRSEVGGGRRLSPTFDEWRIQTEEEDLASGGRSELGRRAFKKSFPVGEK